MSKRTNSRYEPDRCTWLKTKCLNREEFVVVGWSDPEARRSTLDHRPATVAAVSVALARVSDPWLSVAITKWTKATKPIGVKGCVIGFVEIDWHGLIVGGFQVNSGPRGPFVEFPVQRTAGGRWVRVARFKTVREQETFRTVVLAALMRTYPGDFVGYEAEKPRKG